MVSSSPVGRPLLFKTVAELKKKIKDYFDTCFELQWTDIIYRDKDGEKVKKGKGRKTKPVRVLVMIKPPTISGLAVYLKTSRETLINYEDRAKYFDTIKDAKAFILASQEEGALSGKLNPATTIFSLKNNFGFSDKIEIDGKQEHSGEVELKIKLPTV